MNLKKFIAFFLAVILTIAVAVALPACSCNETPAPADPGRLTPYGNRVRTVTAQNPSDTVAIRLIRGKKVVAAGEGTLAYNGKLAAGDIIELESDYRYLDVDLFPALGETVVYSPSGQFSFQVPPAAAQKIYADGTFSGTSHNFKAEPASDGDVTAPDRNLAFNPYDYMYIDEKNDPAAESVPADSAAVAGDEVAAYPHAYANRVTRNEAGFFARNAIDGRLAADGHGDFPYQSWGYDQKNDAEFVLFFGREVTVDKLAFVLRADYSGSKEHDTYWKSAAVEFSDGSGQKLSFAKTGAKQEFALESEVTTSFIRIKDMEAAANTNSEMFAALTEFEAYGRETADANTAAAKSVLTTGFGGKDQRRIVTDAYNSADIAQQMERINKWFVEATDSGSLKVPMYDISKTEVVRINENEWKDAVYYSGLTDAFLTTGNMNSYYYLRGVGNQFEYLVNNGYVTPHGDWYQIGETYLQLEELRNAGYKKSHVIENADHNLVRKPGDSTPNDHKDANRDWSNMGFWWCDSLYMAMNTYTLLARKTGKKEYVEAAYNGYKHWKGVLYNETYDLWHRDSTQIGLTTDTVDAGTGKKIPAFWSRGNAWVFAALAKQLLYLDEEAFPEIYRTYERDFIELAESLAKYQRDDGLWNASIVDGKIGGKSYDGKETTGTSGFLYGFAVGVELGTLDADDYFPIVEKAYDGMTGTCMVGKTGQLGYMQTVGYQPQNYVSESFSEKITNEFGMGLFMMGASALMRMCADYEPPSIVVPADPQAALL